MTNFVLVYFSTFVDCGLLFSVLIRALEVWGSQEALARERNLRKEVEREYQESRFFVF